MREVIFVLLGFSRNMAFESHYTFLLFDFMNFVLVAVFISAFVMYCFHVITVITRQHVEKSAHFVV